MIIQKIFRVPVEEELYEKACRILVDVYNLKPPKSGRFTQNLRILVWEDQTEIGRYRVYCKHNEYETIKKKIRPVDIFNFQYWTDYRFSPDCFASDPMQQPLEQILSLSKKIYDIREVTIDSYNEIEQLRNTDPFKTPQFRNLYK